jgi:hypothetical protein
MKYAVDMGSGGMIYIPSSITIRWAIQVLLRLLPQQFERLQWWYYWQEGFTKYTVEMALGGMIHRKCYEDRFRYSSNIKANASTIWEAAMLVLLIGRTMKQAVEMASSGKFHDSWFRRSTIVRHRDIKAIS